MIVSDWERHLLRCFAAGARLHDIAAAHHYSRSTIKRHATCLYRKLGAAHRAHAVAQAIREGLI